MSRLSSALNLSAQVAGGLGMLSVRLCGPRCSLRSVDHSDNVHLVGLDVIDDSVGAFQNFTYLRELDFRDDATGLGKGADLLGTSGETVNDSQGVLW